MIERTLIRSESLLKQTTSRCPVCRARLPGEVWKRGDARRAVSGCCARCPEHGEAEACIATDARFYWLAQGDPAKRNAAEARPVPRAMARCAACSGAMPGAARRPANVKKLSTCLALIEIVNSCNLACPTCFRRFAADANRSTRFRSPISQRRIQGVIDRKGGIEILQLSGGEPTLHPQFFELLAWCHANPGIDYVLLNTNGVRIATDDAFLDRLGKTFRYGQVSSSICNSMASQEAGQRALRGADLRDVRRRAIERCGEMNIPDHPRHDGDARKPWARSGQRSNSACSPPHVRGIAFQPMFESGRVPAQG